jgi:hypothetical protein
MLFTCPSTYTLYPLDGSGCLDADGRPLPVDFFDADQWVGHGLGIFADPGSATPARVDFLRQALERARDFRSLLVYRDRTYPRITVLAGRDLPTLAVAVRGGPRSVRGWDLRTGVRQPGDSRVCFEHMMPPEGFEFEIVQTAFPHAAMLNDPALPHTLRTGLTEAAAG